MTPDHPLSPPVRTTQPEPNFFAISSPTDPIARLQLEEQRLEYLKWRAALPTSPADLERDFTEYAATLTRSTGQQPRFIESNLHALTTLDRLPRFKELVEKFHHVDMRRLRTIEQQTLGIDVKLLEDAEFWGTLDSRLLFLFTATKPNQLLPGTERIRKLIKELLRAFASREPEPENPGDEEADPESADEESAQLPPPEIPERYDSWPQADGTVSIELRVDQVTATKIEEAVRARAHTEGSSHAQALIDLILTDVTVSVALNLFQSSDVPESPGFLQPFGALDPHDTAQLAEFAKIIRDVDKAGEKKTDSYQASPAIRANVEGRDRICRWPGCGVPAHRCQLDHRINYADGGATNAAGLLSLCQHHHNRKTDEQASYLLDPVNGDVYWLFCDGTWTVDLSDGPLTPCQKRWNQTLAQKLKRRQERARERRNTDGGTKPAPQPLPSNEEPPF